MQYKGSESTTKPNKKRNKNQYEKSIVADFMSHKNVSDRNVYHTIYTLQNQE